MKRILLTMAMMLALPALILCQSNGKNADKKGGSEQAVRQTLNDLAAGLGKNDTAVLDRIYADNYTFVGDTGEIMTKAQRIGAFKSGDLKYESISHEVVSFYLFGDTATVITRFTGKMASGVKYSGGKFLTSLTFVKLKGRWQLVAAHNTRIGER
ncbi:MAG: nuclear transport factor 2 family protein [Acidobacteria bacterium]|nr:nuclear transport factor 2 family protein [Acidobacteriota bacterium]MCA1637012.1 nuclear transport factor 2 family protein [Acidobacteriota bacterium]